MEKKFYEMPNSKVIEIEVENLLAGSDEPDNVLPGGEVPGGGQGNDDEGDAKRMFDWD